MFQRCRQLASQVQSHSEKSRSSREDILVNAGVVKLPEVERMGRKLPEARKAVTRSRYYTGITY